MERNVTGVSPLGDAIDGSAKKRKPRRKPRREPVETIVVDRRIWKTALRLSKGDPRRIKIISRTRVEIRNK